MLILAQPSGELAVKSHVYHAFGMQFLRLAVQIRRGPLTVLYSIINYKFYLINSIVYNITASSGFASPEFPLQAAQRTRAAEGPEWPLRVTS